MVKALSGLRVRFGRRPVQEEGSPGEEPLVDADAMALESAALGPPVLMPAAIFRQVLFEAAEFTPAWMRPRPAPVPVVATIAPTDESPSTKRTRRPKPNGSSATSRPRTRRVAKPDDAREPRG